MRIRSKFKLSVAKNANPKKKKTNAKNEDKIRFFRRNRII